MIQYYYNFLKLSNNQDSDVRIKTKCVQIEDSTLKKEVPHGVIERTMEEINTVLAAKK